MSPVSVGAQPGEDAGAFQASHLGVVPTTLEDKARVASEAEGGFPAD